jgi:hypothetical protein
MFVFDPLGVRGRLRPNHLHPQFNNRKARQALLCMMDLVAYLHQAIGQPQYYRPGYQSSLQWTSRKASRLNAGGDRGDDGDALERHTARPPSTPHFQFDG